MEPSYPHSQIVVPTIGVTSPTFLGGTQMLCTLSMLLYGQVLHKDCPVFYIDAT